MPEFVERRASVLTQNDKEFIVRKLDEAVERYIHNQKSILTEHDRDFILKEIGKTIKKYGCILPEAEKDAASMWYGLLADVGDGDIKTGVRRTRNFLGFLGNMYNKKNVVSGLMFMVFITAMIGAVLKIAGSGLWAFVAGKIN